VCNSVDFVKPI